eukprot:7077101-Prymnesium_polylepis.1
MVPAPATSRSSPDAAVVIYALYGNLFVEIKIVYRQAPGSWHPRGPPASLSTGNRLRAREVPST